MDLQAMVNAMNESQAKDRGNYHLTYGQLIEALKAAPEGAKLDSRVKGIGSWRGSYIEIALFTDEDGYSAQEGEFTGDYSNGAYSKWAETHDLSGDFPSDAKELATLLESLIGKDFVGYKGGNYTIETYKPLWLELDSGSCNEVAIIGIDKDLKLITKEIEA